MKTIFGGTSRMKVIFLDGMLKTGAIFFLLSTIFTFLLDLYNYLDEYNSLYITDHFVRTKQNFQHIAFYLSICLLGGMMVGIINYVRLRKQSNASEKAFTNSENN